MPDDQQAKRATPSRQNHAVTLIVPYPPSVNRYWRRVGNRTVLSRAAREFRKRVMEMWFLQKVMYDVKPFNDQPVEMIVKVFPPDRRKRDLDNILKAVFDGIESAGIINDDSQVRRLRVEFLNPGGAMLIVGICSLDQKRDEDKA